MILYELFDIFILKFKMIFWYKVKKNFFVEIIIKFKYVYKLKGWFFFYKLNDLEN